MIPAADREHILAHTASLWRELAGARLFLTGGTGFFGVWLLEAIAAANDALGVGIDAMVLSRDPDRFAGEMPGLAARPEFEWLAGNTEDFSFPAQRFDYVIHLATASAAELVTGGSELGQATLRGTQRVLRFARARQANRLLLASSGAVYGRQPQQLTRIPETFLGAAQPPHPASTYGQVKRLSEQMCALAGGLDCVIARGFSFFGPHLPLTGKFAIGSFMRDALSGGPIRIHGDGTPVRSYLYAADMVIWLITLLLRGKPSEAYNVGSDQAVELVDLARAVALAAGGMNVDIAERKSPDAMDRYVPAIDKARRELGLDVRISLATGLGRTIEWATDPAQQAA